MSEFSAAAGQAGRTHPQLAQEILATCRLSWPIVAANLAIQFMQTTDLMMLGWLSPKALAAAALGFNLYVVFFIFGIGVIAALAPIAAKAIGADAGNAAGVRAATQQALFTALLIAAPIWVLLWFAEPILLGFGQDPELAHQAAIYLHALQWALAPTLAYFALRSVFAALGRTGPTLVAAVLAVIVNGLANYMLIFGHWGAPALGIVGSGLATLGSSVFMLAILLAYARYDKQLKRYALIGGPWRFDAKAFAQLWRLGAPIAVMLTFEVAIFAWSVELMGLFGGAALAAHAIVLNIASLAFMIPLGLGQAATVRVGHAFGARDPVAISRAGWAAFLATMAYVGASALTMLTIPLWLLAGFIDASAPENAATVAFALSFLKIAALFQLFDGAQCAAANMLRGVHDADVPMVVALLGYWAVGAPIGLALAFKTPLGPLGVWIGLAIGLAIVSALLLARWRMREIAGFLQTAQ